ncbi:MAG: hypothetical protein WBS18_03260 [Candidatus Acidiferrales bacterium]
MAAGSKQRFPTWWQALILVGSGVVIGFSSCVGVLSGINRSQNHQLSNLYVFGFFAGAAVFIAGMVLFLVAAIRALLNPPQVPVFATPPGVAPGPPEGVIAHATHPHLFPDSGPGILSAPGAARSAPPPAEVGSALMRLRIAIFMAMIVSIFALIRMAAVSQSSQHSRNLLVSAVASVLVLQLPYLVALARTWDAADRAGLALAMATGFVHALTTWNFLMYARYNLLGLEAAVGVHAAVNIGVIVLAYLARRAAGVRSNEAGLLVTFGFTVLLYDWLIGILVSILKFSLAHR